MPDELTKVVVFTGFLGSGKTSLMQKLLPIWLHEGRVAILENEIGQVGIDGARLQSTGSVVSELTSGCICCTLAGDFPREITRLIRRVKPLRLLIEPSGIGRLTDVLAALSDSELKDKLQIEHILCTVDATRYALYQKNFADFYTNQIMYTQAVCFSHTKGIEPALLQNAVDRVRDLNPKATLLTTPWEELGAQDMLRLLREGSLSQFQDEMHACETRILHHRRGKGATPIPLETWGKELPNAIAHNVIDAFVKALTGQQYGNIIRAKGELLSNNGYVSFDVLPGEAIIAPTAPCAIGKVCVIGQGLDRVKLNKAFS